MDTGQARKLFEKYAPTMAYVEVQKPSGDLDIGSAFHVGEGVFVTARHVVEGNEVVEVGMTESPNGILSLASGPYFHPRAEIDIAVFKVDEINPVTPVVPLGGHLNDWLGQSDFVLTEAVVLGYPRIPMSRDAILVATRAEVSAQIDLYDKPHVHFVLSAMARGGFSGGVAFSEYGFALGVITQSLIENGQPVESGYMAAITVEPILECLGRHKLLPDCQAEGWDGLWNTTSLHFYDSDSHTVGPSGAKSGLIAATVDIFDDGKQFSITISCNDPEVLAKAQGAATRSLDGLRLACTSLRDGMIRLNAHGVGDSTGDMLSRAGEEAANIFIQSGYIPSP